MASKASGALILIIEKQYASWYFMGTASSYVKYDTSVRSWSHTIATADAPDEPSKTTFQRPETLSLGLFA